MFSKITAVAIAGLLTCVSAVPTGGASLPSTSIISVVDATGAVIGTLNGYGNFSAPGPSYPFRAFTTTDGYANLDGYNLVPCTATGFLACGGTVAGTSGSFYTLGKNLVSDGTDGLWSIDAITDAAGGTNSIGVKYGIPVYVGATTAAIPVTLLVNSASG